VSYARKTGGPVKERERWRIRATLEADKGYITREDTVKFLKPLRLRWYGHVERM
jgi:hypothetical protein